MRVRERKTINTCKLKKNKKSESVRERKRESEREEEEEEGPHSRNSRMQVRCSIALLSSQAILYIYSNCMHTYIYIGVHTRCSNIIISGREQKSEMVCTTIRPCMVCRLARIRAAGWIYACIKWLHGVS